MSAQQAVPALPRAAQAPIFRAQRHAGARAHGTPSTMSVALYLFIRLLLGLLAFCERATTAAHTRLCQFLGLVPCEIHGPRDSAIVIVGGDDDLGRRIALNFSQLGYTVFALCPLRTASPSAASSDTEASNVSSLIQEWHQKIKRSGQPNSTSPWGLVAPIVLDLKSSAQRTRAVETVDAYCAAHNLHLVAVFVLPAPSFVSSKLLQTGRADLNLNITAWSDVLHECLMEPISAVQDYVNALSAASGRVILLLASGHNPWIPSLQMGTLLSAAHFLRQELDSLGVKVSTVAIGPSAPVKSPSVHPRASVPGGFLSDGHGVSMLNIRNTIEEVMQCFPVRHEDVWRVLQTIVRSRYPREHYCVGLHASLQVVYDLMPTAVHFYARSISPYFS